ncbi:MAG TPA: murein L,D-transpeptidase, partial [Sulfitobacter sp.]|nr:murein L,D-transpeptidase [Sulfitobacter sp.]
MGFSATSSRHLPNLIAGLALMITALIFAAPATAQVTAFKQAVAEAAAQDDDIAAFYRENDYAAIWTGA